MGMPVAGTVTTNPATNIQVQQFTANGSCTAGENTSITERGFLWFAGLSGTPLLSDNVTVAPGTGSGAFSAVIPGLSGGTTYRVRAYTIYEAGTAYGGTISVTTAPAAPDEPITGSSTLTLGAVVHNAAALSWTAVEHADSYDIYVGGVFSHNVVGLSDTLTGLSPETSYNVVVYGRNSLGQGPVSNTVSFTTAEPPPPSDDPPVMSGLQMYLDARTIVASDGDPIGTWADQTDNGNDAVAPFTEGRPTYRVNVGPEGGPALEFRWASADNHDPASQLFQLPSNLIDTRASTMLVVGQSDNDGNQNCVYVGKRFNDRFFIRHLGSDTSPPTNLDFVSGANTPWQGPDDGDWKVRGLRLDFNNRVGIIADARYPSTSTEDLRALTDTALGGYLDLGATPQWFTPLDGYIKAALYYDRPLTEQELDETIAWLETTFLEEGEEPPPPDEVTEAPVLSLGAVTHATAALSWTEAEHATIYDIHVDGVLSHSVTGLSDTLTGLDPETNYEVEVYGRNPDSTGPASNTVSFVTDPEPQPASDLQLAEVGDGVRSTWEASGGEFILRRQRWIGSGDPT